MLVAAPAAHAADPIMPLSEVQPGMRCTGLSVIKGTEVTSFEVEILDVIAGEAGLTGPRLLIRVSGPAVDATGVGPGFSGSPILCNGRNAGAVSESLGEYGNHVALATPIEEMLRDRPAAPASSRRDPALLRSARPLTTPLTVSGVSGRAASLLRRAARRARRPLLITPAGPARGYAPVDLRPGSAMSAGISTGDLAIGAVGTVTYRDGEDIWAFGHPLEGIGQRSLFLQDAYVYSVIENPLGLFEFGAITYKLASMDGNVHGAVTNDKVGSISGKLAALPQSFPLSITGRARGGARVSLDSLLADERPLGLGAGLGLVGPLGVTQALSELMRDFGPVTFRMCAHFRVSQRPRPMGFCNDYFSVDDALNHVSRAGDLIDFFELAPLNVERVAIALRARPGVKTDVLVRARAPRRVRRGKRMRVRLAVQRRRGERRTIGARVRVPRSLRPGFHRMTLRGTGGGFSESALIFELLSALKGDTAARASAEPRSVGQLARQIRALRRPMGIEARFGRGPWRIVRRSDEVAFEGRVRLPVRVKRRSVAG